MPAAAQRLLVALKTLRDRCRREVVGRDEGDPPVTLLDEVGHGAVRATHIVREHGIEGVADQMAVDQHDRQAAAQEPCEELRIGLVVDRVDDQAADPLVHDPFDPAGLLLPARPVAARQHAVSMGVQSVLDTSQDCRDIRHGHRRNDHANHASPKLGLDRRKTSDERAARRYGLRQAPAVQRRERLADGTSADAKLTYQADLGRQATARRVFAVCDRCGQAISDPAMDRDVRGRLVVFGHQFDPPLSENDGLMMVAGLDRSHPSGHDRHG